MQIIDTYRRPLGFLPDFFLHESWSLHVRFSAMNKVSLPSITFHIYQTYEQLLLTCEKNVFQEPFVLIYLGSCLVQVLNLGSQSLAVPLSMDVNVVH